MRYLIPVAALSAIGVTACGNGGDDFINAAPIISSGTALAVTEGATVQLNGAASDPNGDAITVLWSQESGPDVDLVNSDSLNASFEAPNVNQTVDIVLRLTVTDSRGASSSQTMTVSIADSPRDGPSPQGIPDDTENRRDRARGNRNNNRPNVNNREVRTYDGSNNNIDNPNWGATFEHLQRLAPADYADGISELAGPDRPSARAVSNGVVDQPEGTSLPNSVNGTDFIWQWGQFIDHDLDLTDGAEESADILVPEGDPFFDPASTGTQVITFNRALFDSSTGTDSSNPREQENEITSWIDGSMIYGSDDERNAALRETDTPFLATSAGNLLPFNTSSLPNANGFITDPTALFLAGDIRANEQLGLTVMHTLYVREHNRIAQILLDNDPDADVDDVY